MNQYRIPEILLGVLLTVAVFAIGYSLSTQLAPYPQEQTSTDQPADPNAPPKKPETESFWVKAVSDPVALFTGVVGVFTVVLALATIGLLKATANSVKLARQEFIATHRPKVIVRRVLGPIGNSPTEGQETVFIIVVNTGDSKATIDQFGGEIAADSDWSLRPSGTNTLDPLGEPITLESGEAYPFPVVVPFGTIHRANIAIADNQVVSGALVYRDENGTARETAFRRIYSRERQRFMRTGNREDEYAD